MASRRGISLLHLLALPPGFLSIIPDDLRRDLQNLVVLDYSSATSDETYVHYGTIQALSETLPALNDGYAIRAPGLHKGLPFQLMIRRGRPDGDENVEPAPTLYLCDLFLDRAEIEVPFLRPAQRVEGIGATPTQLEEVDPNVGPTRVYLVGGGTLRVRIERDGVSVSFVDYPDPFDPAAPTGAVFRLTFDPPHFFFGPNSKLGMTVDHVTFDNSVVFTPAAITARGHGPEWTGLSIREATMFFPRWQS